MITLSLLRSRSRQEAPVLVISEMAWRLGVGGSRGAQVDRAPRSTRSLSPMQAATDALERPPQRSGSEPERHVGAGCRARRRQRLVAAIPANEALLDVSGWSLRRASSSAVLAVLMVPTGCHLRSGQWLNRGRVIAVREVPVVTTELGRNCRPGQPSRNKLRGPSSLFRRRDRKLGTRHPFPSIEENT
jgi:hypothetical protein